MIGGFQPPIFKEWIKIKNQKAIDFLKEHGMSPELTDPGRCAETMLQDMERGLAGEKSSLPMIPTYIKNEGSLPKNEPVIVIDAGGTNFRRGLATFNDEGCTLEAVYKQKMPGTEKPASWEEFISFVADSIMPIIDKSDYIGFCFSYNADITPDIDGLVKCIDKEVVITGSSGKLVGASLQKELESRGVRGKRIFIVNDTVAALLGSSAGLDRSAYSGFIGQISGTGANTCCALPRRRIGKLGLKDDTKILINLESGMYDGVPQGDFDKILDRESNNPGEKIMEKMIAGVYLGELGRLMLLKAAEEGLISAASGKKAAALGRIDASVIDAWACGEKLDMAAASEEDGDFARTISLALFERSARCMCANLLAIMLLTGEGKDGDKPVCICAEGSLVDRSRHFRPMLEELLKKYGADAGCHGELKVGHETTLPGAAVAALLNR
ncbi:MAG: hypothetical protein ACOX68_05855 [Candidatus Limivicinus sp.]|jgi:hexokinase